jgi:hypothetical protein
MFFFTSRTSAITHGGDGDSRTTAIIHGDSLGNAVDLLCRWIVNVE